MAKQGGVEHVFVHCFMDGRDTSHESGAGFIEQSQKKMRQIGVAQIASVSVRYYAMDRNKRCGLVLRAFAAMVLGNVAMPTELLAAARECYEVCGTAACIEQLYR